MKPDNIILEGITGSIAYGLNTPSSDEDVKGIYIIPTSLFVGIEKFKPKLTFDHVKPDWSYHEVSKFISLSLKGNPTITELLWLEGYLTLTKQGKMLVDNRHLFLSTKAIRNAYGGYALSQAKKLNARGGTYGNGRNKRFEKHSRHCLRLLYQGKELLETGKLTIRVSHEMREELFAFGKLSVNEIVNTFEKKFREFDTIKSVLPDEPGYDGVNDLLLRLRKSTW